MREPVLDRSRYMNYRAEGAPDDFHHVAWKTMKYDEMNIEELGFSFGIGFKFKPVGNQINLNYYYK